MNRYNAAVFLVATRPLELPAATSSRLSRPQPPDPFGIVGESETA
jgi:hypothetical protein